MGAPAPRAPRAPPGGSYTSEVDIAQLQGFHIQVDKKKKKRKSVPAHKKALLRT